MLFFYTANPMYWFVMPYVMSGAMAAQWLSAFAAPRSARPPVLHVVASNAGLYSGSTRRSRAPLTLVWSG